MEVECIRVLRRLFHGIIIIIHGTGYCMVFPACLQSVNINHVTDQSEISNSDIKTNI